MAEKKKTGVMGGMSLSGFSAPPVSDVVKVEAPPIVAPAKAKQKAKSKAEKLEPVNIKLPSSLKKWFRDRAEQVRANNPEPVPADERVYPQHLMQIAGELLMTSNVDWDKAQSAEDIRKQLGL